VRGRGPRILLVGGTYRALCVLERLLERGERVVAFLGQEGGGERDFCSEILELCDRAGIPARRGRKLGEEMVRWLDDRIRPELAIAVGVSTEIPLAIGGNCRLGLVELVDRFQVASCPGVALRQRGHETTTRALPARADDAGDAYLETVEAQVELLGEYLDRLQGSCVDAAAQIRFDDARLTADELELVAARTEPGAEADVLELEAKDYLGADSVLAVRDPEEAFALLAGALALGEADEIVCPGIVSESAVAGLRRSGARVVFADVDPARLTLDPVAARAAVGAHTRALLLAHPFGQPAPLDELYGLAEERGLEVIEDGAGSLGARFGQARVGASPCACVFRVPLGGAGRAALLCVPPALASRLPARARELRLGDGAAHALRERLARNEDALSARRAHAAHYSAELCRYDAFQVPPTPGDALPVYSHYALRVTRFARTSAEDLHKLLAEGGIETRRIAVTAVERDLARLPATDHARAGALLLPVSPALLPAHRDRVLEAIFDYAIG
jgi:dTDP-4-amino-4,6-dideoxygalactose transaminase